MALGQGRSTFFSRFPLFRTTTTNNNNLYRGGSIHHVRNNNNNRNNCSRIIQRILVIGICCFLLVQVILYPLFFTIFMETDISQPSRGGPPRYSFRPNHVRKQQQQRNRVPDGTFNGFPVYYRNNPQTPKASTVHCVGENFQYSDDSWTRQSCHFTHLCFDLHEKDFVLFRSYQEEVLSRFAQAREYIDISTIMYKKTPNSTNHVSVGGINYKWNYHQDNGPNSLKWFPRVVDIPKPGDDDAAAKSFSYYELPREVIMVPFHSMSGMNPGHLVWDDFLPIYTLLNMFQLLLDNQELLLLRVFPKDGERLWGSCELNDENEQICRKMIQKFSPVLLGHYDHPYNITTTNDTVFEEHVNHVNHPPSNYICSSHGVAGMGLLTDHGTTKGHGWDEDDYKKPTHNHGRGGLLYDFRNFMVRNVLLPSSSSENNGQPAAAEDVDSVVRYNVYDHSSKKRRPFRIVFSMASSDIKARNQDFTPQMQAIQNSFDPQEVVVESYTFKKLSLREQIQIVNDATVYISICGGGAVTGMFLPQGASVILYYLQSGGVTQNKLTKLPAQLDWDLFNNLSHLKVHWFPVRTMDQKVDLRALVLLIKQELQIISDRQQEEEEDLFY